MEKARDELVTYLCVFVYAYIYIYHIYICIHIYTYIMYIYIYIYIIYIYTYIYNYTYTYIHVYLCVRHTPKAARGKGLHSGVAGVSHDFVAVAIVSNAIWVG